MYLGRRRRKTPTLKTHSCYAAAVLFLIASTMKPHKKNKKADENL